ncbi:MAG: PD40 domain-containing protein [Anaerolineaceae bacterium]|nr:PD40 domain-containing protein [Anaerolineaceae bacterium]
MAYVARLTQWMLLALMLIISGVTTPAQDDFQPILVLRQTDTQLEFLNLNADGSTTLVGSIPGLGLYPNLGSTWSILVPIDVAPSPDGEQVAFTAMNGITLGNPTVLFIVDLNPVRVRQFEIPDIASVTWSPSGDAILLGPPSHYIGERIGESGEIYLFNIANETLSLVIASEENSIVSYIDEVLWSPDGQRIVMVYDIPSADRFVEEIALINRDGTSFQPLTNMADLTPETITNNYGYVVYRDVCFIEKIEWSESNARFYYAQVCGEAPFQSIAVYSVDLSGNNRIELDLAAYFSENFGLDFTGQKFTNLLVAEDTIWLVVRESKSTLNLDIIRISGPNNAEIVASYPDQIASFAAISEGKTGIAITTASGVSSEQFVLDVDIATDQINTLTLPKNENGLVCQVVWLDNETIIVSEDENYICAPRAPQTYRPSSAFIWRPDTGIIEPVDFGSASNQGLILPRRNVLGQRE